MATAGQLQQCVVGVYPSFQTAKEALRAVEAEGIPHPQISLVTHDVAREVPREEPIQFGDNTETSAAGGAGMGGLLGLLLGAPLALVPGVGPLLWIGPVAAGMTGAVVGGFLGAMAGWGVHDDHVRQYEDLVKSGRVLVVVNGTPDEVADAQRVLRETAAESVTLHAATGDDSPEVDDRPGVSLPA